jgi:hypothetical protein
MGAIGKQPETFQKKGNGLSPSVTFTHDPLNNYSVLIGVEPIHQLLLPLSSGGTVPTSGVG